MTLDDLIKRIRAAARDGDWNQVQPLTALMHETIRQEGRPLSGSQAMHLVEALGSSPELSASLSGGTNGGQIIAQLRGLLADRKADGQAVKACLDSLYRLLSDPTAVVERDDLRGLLQDMRSTRHFEMLARTADKAITRMPDDAVARRLYGQALIDSGQVNAGIEFLKSTLTMDGLPHTERDEINGLLGRAYKQLYVNHISDASTPARYKQQFRPELERAIAHYGACFDPDSPMHNYWHGVNLVALLRLARLDGQPEALQRFKGLSSEEIAGRLLKALEGTAENSNDPWILATVAECHIARRDIVAAERYFKIFTEKLQPDAFTLAGTLRQLEEVYRIDAGEGPAGAIVASLKAAQIQSKSGQFLLDGDKLGQLQKYAAQRETGLRESHVEGNELVRLKLLQTVVKRATAIAALSDYRGATLGTGFVFRGKDLRPSLGDDLYLITNAHVMSDPASANYESEAPLNPSTVRITLEGAEANRLKCEQKVVWQSRIGDHDAAIVRLLPEECKGVVPLPLCSPERLLRPAFPEDAEAEKSASFVSVMGYPLGGPLSLSAIGPITGANGVLVDIGARQKDASDPRYLHYRASTEPGNSGSPVFETTEWEVIGLHHEGFDAKSGRPRLGGKDGRSHANEGVSIHSIGRAMQRDKV